MPSNAGLYCGKPRDTSLCEQHTEKPEGLSYLGFFEWADEMAKTHKQIKCEGCGLYKIWVPKKPALQEQK